MNIKLNMNLILLAFGLSVWSGAWGCVDRPAKETNEPPATTNRRERPEDKKASTTQQAEKGWILGTYHLHPSPRLLDDNGLSALVQDQRIGRIPFVFESQRNYHRALLEAGLEEDLVVMNKDGNLRFLNEQERAELRRRYPRPKISFETGAMILLKGHFVTEDLPTIINASKKSSAMVEKPIEEVVKTYYYFLADDDFERCEEIRLGLSSDLEMFSVVFERGCLPRNVECALEQGFGNSRTTARTTHGGQDGRSPRISLQLENVENEPDLRGFSITNVQDQPHRTLLLQTRRRSFPRGVISVFLNPTMD
ncbi:MAG: hypothetical protein O7F76_05645, partial [Planctomycetota bacterium]|nr:hypothetical protein [Planctomycetota bacterium]